MLYVGLSPLAEKALAILILKYSGEDAEMLVEDALCESLTHSEKHSIGVEHDDYEEELREELERKLNEEEEELQEELEHKSNAE